MLQIFGTGMLIATLCSLIAGIRRSIAIPLVLLCIGVVCFWGTLFFGSDIGYREWQAMPDPPPEAFADASPLGALIFGWLPAGIYCGLIFLMTRVIRFMFFKNPPDETVTTAIDVITTTTGTSTPVINPYQSSFRTTPGKAKRG